MAQQQSAQSVALKRLGDLMMHYVSEESRAKGLRFTPDATDVIISTSHKSGTTWTQQICHGLRSRGDMSFDEIDLVVPTLEISHDYGHDINTPQTQLPRMFKTHMWYPDVPKGAGKYIVLIRQPTDSVLSMFYFLQDWLFADGEITPDAFVHWWYGLADDAEHLKGLMHLHHIMSWYPYRLDENVLWLHYEDLKENLRECVRLIAEFLDIGKGDDELQELVTQQAGLEFMQKHKHKFDDHQLKLARNEAMGLAKDAGLITSAAKVHVGTSGRGKNIFLDETVAFIQQQWKKTVTSQTGHATYDSFRAAINKELGRTWLK